MTMLPVRFLSCEIVGILIIQQREMGMVGDDKVVEEERTNSLTEQTASKDSHSTSHEQHKVDNEEASGWLQLSIGCHQSPIIPNHQQQAQAQIHPTSLLTSTSGSGPPSLVELELLPPPASEQLQLQETTCRPIFIPPPEIRGPWGSNLLMTSTTQTQTQTQTQAPSGFIFQQPSTPASTWPFQIPLPIPIPMPMGMASSSSSPNSSFSTHLHHQHYLPTPFHFPPTFDSHVRVVDPPRRPHSGVWFMLQASPTQAKQPFLPQIPKSYLRIKDGRMTVRLLLKYLVNKLRLDSESEIEIRCRGQQLVPFLTLEHVRDNIWSQREGGTTSSSLLSESSTSTTDHIMVLHYGRCA